MKVKELEAVVESMGKRLAHIEGDADKLAHHDDVVCIANDVRRDLYRALEEAREAQRLVNIGLAAMLIAVAVAAAVFLG